MSLDMSRAVVIALGLAAASGSAALAADAEHEAWRGALAHAVLPAGACFKADYPDRGWTRVACSIAPLVPYLPHHAGAATAGADTVGDGRDYAASAATLITQSVGTFPTVSGLTSEKGAGRANSYSIQLNSDFFTSTVCSGAANPSSCLAWQQFVYSNPGQAFMQYWLIDYGNKCPSGGWMAYSGDCYRNSVAVRVPSQAATKLASLSITGVASVNGTDMMMFTTATSAYTTTGADSVVKLADGWHQSEFNIVGNGGGSQANFNTGTSIQAHIVLSDGTNAAPACATSAGTTAETNNLTLGSCSTAPSSITFGESN